MSGVRLENITKKFPGGISAVKDLSFEVNNNELLILTGPQNCGKSTILRLIAGLDDATSGEIFINNQLANYVDPIERNIAIVYQNLTLYPHLTIRGNLEFGLKFSKHRGKHITESIKHIAEILEIESILDKFPGQIDVFERQRIAFAKAEIKQPKILLVDRVCPNCGEDIKQQLCDEIYKIWLRLKKTMIVAIDSEMVPIDSDLRIAVMNNGRLEEIGTHDELYNNPTSKFVAGFMGKGKTTFINAKVIEESGKILLKIGANVIPAREDKVNTIKEGGYVGKEVIIALRPEDIIIGENSENPNCIKAKVDAIETLKGGSFVHLVTEGAHFFVRPSGKIICSKGEEISALVDTDKIILFDKDTEKTI